MKEIEKKFQVIHTDYKKGLKPVHVIQAYLFNDDLAHARIRIEDDVRAFLALKKHISGFTRWEFEYPIPLKDAQEIMDQFAEGRIVEKNRYFPEFKGRRWDVDEYLGNNEGLIVAEIELEQEDEHFDKPAWAGEELTEDPRYLNVNLAVFPYSKWKDVLTR